MSSTYVLGNEVGGSAGELRYFYGLRKEDDGTLYINRVDLKSSDTADSVQLFPQLPPVEFEDIEIPGDDYYDGRNPTTKELINDRAEVTYEQWRWDERLISYYLNSEGELVVAIGEDKMISESSSNHVIGNSTTVFEYNITGRVSDINIRIALINAGWNGLQEVLINIADSGSISSSVQDRPALTISGTYPNGITIENNGSIIGANAFVKTDGTYVSPGTAIKAATECVINNNITGIISGGSSLAAGVDDGFGIDGIDFVTLTDNGTINSTN